MASVMANHPLYHQFTEPGFQGSFQILERNGATYRVRIWEAAEGGEAPADDKVMDVLWTNPLPFDAWTGSFYVLEKNFAARICVLRCAPVGSNAETIAIWLLDKEPTTLHE